VTPIAAIAITLVVTNLISSSVVRFAWARRSVARVLCGRSTSRWRLSTWECVSRRVILSSQIAIDMFNHQVMGAG